MQHQSDGHGEHEVAEPARVGEREEREHPQPHPGRAQQIDRPAADPVRERAPGRDDGEVHGGGDEYGVERGLLGDPGRRGGVDEDEGGDHVVADVLRHAGAHGDQHVPPVVAQNGHQRELLGTGPRRRAAGLGLCQRLLEHRRFIDRQTNPQTDDHQHSGQEERDAPSPGDEGAVGEDGGQQRQHARGEELPGRCTGLRPGGPEAARRASPCSDTSRTAPPHSPPSAKPCTRRSTVSRTGAAAPTVACVGSRPMAKVAPPISSRLSTSSFLRPSRSP